MHLAQEAANAKSVLHSKPKKMLACGCAVQHSKRSCAWGPRTLAARSSAAHANLSWIIYGCARKCSMKLVGRSMYGPRFPYSSSSQVKLECNIKRKLTHQVQQSSTCTFYITTPELIPFCAELSTLKGQTPRPPIPGILTTMRLICRKIKNQKQPAKLQTIT